MQVGAMTSNPMYMSVLRNDTHFAYTKRYHMDYTTMNNDYTLHLDTITSKDKIYKIMISSKSYCNSSEIIKFNVLKRSVSGESTILCTIYCDIKTGCTVDMHDIVIDDGESLYLEYHTDELDHQITVVSNHAQFDLIMFCQPRNMKGVIGNA